MLALRGTHAAAGDEVGGTRTEVTLPPMTGSISVFLRVYMVRYWTQETSTKTIDNEDGELQATVISVARRLITCFDGMCDWLVDAPPGGGVYANMPEVLV